MRAWIVFACSVLIAAGCGSDPSTPTGPTTSVATVPPAPPAPTPPAPSPSPLPTPPAGCEAWPSALADLFGRLTVAPNTCLVREASALPSEYRPRGRRVIYRNPARVGGEIHSIAHELCHGHQHRVILDAGIADIAVVDEGDWLLSNWARTSEGRDYLQAAGYVQLASSSACVRSPQPGCWSQDPAAAEMGFSLASYGNPMEDNAEFCAIWQNAANEASWSRPEILRIAPRRAAWAERYLR